MSPGLLRCVSAPVKFPAPPAWIHIPKRKKKITLTLFPRSQGVWPGLEVKTRQGGVFVYYALTCIHACTCTCMSECMRLHMCMLQAKTGSVKG